MRQLYHDLKWARVEAIVLNTRITLASNSSWCAGWEISSASQVLKHRDGIENCKITFSGSLSATSFQFIADGSSNYQSGHFYFYDQEKVTMKIIINPVGRVRWED
ncbi:MAG: GspH/FimT family protein [Pseudomonadota bacterium]